MVVGDFAEEKDVIVIGGGPGGYHAAIRAAQLGREVTLIESKDVGGACLNESCVPSKVYTEAASQLKAMKKAPQYGLDAVLPERVDFSQLQEKKHQVVNGSAKGVHDLLKNYQIEVVEGSASFLSSTQLGVEKNDAFEKFKFENAVIATGSSRYWPGEGKMSTNRQLCGSEIYQLHEIPGELLIVGSDYISLEVAHAFHALGTNVTLCIEEKNPLAFDTAVNKELLRLLKKEKIKVHTEVTIQHVNETDTSIVVDFQSKKGAEQWEGACFYRPGMPRPRTDTLHLEAAGIEVDEQGFIPINQAVQTNQSHIFAVGDVTSSPKLAAIALKQGKVAGEVIGGMKSEWDPFAYPVISRTFQPVASAGLTKEEALQEGYAVKESTFPMTGNGYAAIAGEKEGLVKVVSEAETGVLLGFHSIGPGAVEMISAAVQVLEMGGRVEDAAYPYYPHPSFNEAWMEAVEGLEEKAIHLR
ncbi:dihydrolipoamide dehydrogenase [Salsuginibacillus halophilus]|uniref:Dihydrolipoamide dehydrogenase n=1 Tax=Salsuginibacillus halophilus TaxID=517424 RepID=A0A2P8HQK2_9BACI|nr:FAD-dependent oxidoreductase [Salsuginibacillus halophilus]PSL48464.1 dihydrolipoamide dehydrogenase [Salsuginibacillus halophilus]